MKMSKKCVALMAALAVCAVGSAMAEEQTDNYNTTYGFWNNEGSNSSYSVMVGSESYISGSYQTVLGVGNGATADGATAVGYGNAARGENSSTIGYSNEAWGKNSTTLGTNSFTTAENSTALGHYAYAGAKNSTSIGTEAVNYTSGTVSFGHKAGDFAGYFRENNSEAGKNETAAAADGYTAVYYDSDSFSRLTNVADGTDDQDAATYGQLKTEKTNRETADQTLQDNIDDEVDAREEADEALKENLNQEAASRLAGDNYLNTRIDQVEKDANKGIAKATALAALHPLDYDPSNKFDIAAAGGFYKGENAFALGAFYRPNRDVMFSLASTVSGGDNAYNVGVSFKVGKSSKVEKPAANTAELYQMISTMQEQLAAQQRRIEELEANQAK